jgi:hypothetical protein
MRVPPQKGHLHGLTAIYTLWSRFTCSGSRLYSFRSENYTVWESTYTLGEPADALWRSIYTVWEPADTLWEGADGLGEPANTLWEAADAAWERADTL